MEEKKERLDKVVQEQFSHLSRTQIQVLISEGKVSVDGQVQIKPGHLIHTDVVVALSEQQPKFVSRAGFKLEKAIDHFGVDVKNLVVLDAGLSTGGFTDCLLQKGAKRVYGVDVGSSQVNSKISADVRVHVMENTNLRHLTSVGELVDLVTLDLSFISVLKVLDAVNRMLKSKGYLLILIKPQFELSRECIGKGGIVKDECLHQDVIEKVTSEIGLQGFSLCGVTDSPITGANGNKEFLAYFQKD